MTNKSESYFRQLDQQFERQEPYSPYYWPMYGEDRRKQCSYCAGAVADNHPVEDPSLCPAYEAYVADLQSGAITR